MSDWHPDLPDKEDFIKQFVPVYLAAYALEYNNSHKPPIKKALKLAEEAFEAWENEDEKNYDRSW